MPNVNWSVDNIQSVEGFWLIFIMNGQLCFGLCWHQLFMEAFEETEKFFVTHCVALRGSLIYATLEKKMWVILSRKLVRMGEYTAWYSNERHINSYLRLMQTGRCDMQKDLD